MTAAAWMMTTMIISTGEKMPLTIKEKESCWEFLRKTDLPIFIYGMGDGALKILSVFEKYHIPTAGFFASDEFVRGKSICCLLPMSPLQAEDCLITNIFVRTRKNLMRSMTGSKTMLHAEPMRM